MKKPSVAETFKKHIIKSILEGKYIIGEKLPPERELAEELKISRIIVHTGITELNAKGLLKIVPRKGTYVNDYKRHGGIELLDILMTDTGLMEKNIFNSIMASRRLLETEFALLSAENRSEENIENIFAIIKKEEVANDIEDITNLDFSFHHELACATGNSVYPLLIKSMQGTYTNLIKEFYNSKIDRAAVIASHKMLAEAIKNKDKKTAKTVMEKILTHGEENMPQNKNKEVTK